MNKQEMSVINFCHLQPHQGQVLIWTVFTVQSAAPEICSDCPVGRFPTDKGEPEWGTLTATYNSDHVYPGAVRDGDAAPTVVLYAELGTPEFKQAHQQLVQLADSGKVKNGIKDI